MSKNQPNKQPMTEISKFKKQTHPDKQSYSTITKVVKMAYKWKLSRTR